MQVFFVWFFLALLSIEYPTTYHKVNT